MRTDLKAPVTEPGTPLPWRTCEGTLDDSHMTGIETVTKNGLRGTPVAECDHDWEELRISWKMASDNATYIVTACNAYPQLFALVQEMVGALGKGAEQFDLLSKLSRAPRIREVEKGTGKKVARRKGDVLQSEAECGAAYLRATLTRAKGVMGV